MYTPNAWDSGPLATIRAMYAHVRAWMCTRICDGYDRRAGRIADAAIAARDAAIDDARAARIDRSRAHGGDI